MTGKLWRGDWSMVRTVFRELGGDSFPLGLLYCSEERRASWTHLDDTWQRELSSLSQRRDHLVLSSVRSASRIFASTLTKKCLKKAILMVLSHQTRREDYIQIQCKDAILLEKVKEEGAHIRENDSTNVTATTFFTRTTKLLHAE